MCFPAVKGLCVGPQAQELQEGFQSNRLAIPSTIAWAFLWNGLGDCNPPKPEQHLLRASILQHMDPSKSSKLHQANPQGALTRRHCLLLFVLSSLFSSMLVMICFAVVINVDHGFFLSMLLSMSIMDYFCRCCPLR